jgi:hypothetical protein
MNDLPSKTESPAEPESTTGEKPSIAKTHEEFIGDEATPSSDKSEYENGAEGDQPGNATRSNVMSDQSPEPASADSSNTIKDPDTWKTGDEPATGAQLSYLKTLASETKYEFDESAHITKADASKLIDELRQKSGRVQEGK